MATALLTLVIMLTTPDGRELEYGKVDLHEVKNGKGSRVGSLSDRDGTPVRSLPLPIPKGLPLSLVSGFEARCGRRKVSVSARDGFTSGERPKAKRYGRLVVDAGDAWTVDAHVSADPRKPEEWSLYVSARPGEAVAAPSVDLDALAALVGEVQGE